MNRTHNPTPSSALPAFSTELARAPALAEDLPRLAEVIRGAES